ncbi:MAG: CRTAC1 family protein, partial [Bryobacteraceae bacterium]
MSLGVHPVLWVLPIALFSAEQNRQPLLPVFEDVTAKSGITFQLLSSRTPQKYLIETMPGGVAMLDYDG